MSEANGAPLADNHMAARYEELARLAGSLAHEIKNPLSVIRLNLDLLAEEFQGVDAPREKRALKKVALVQKQCARLERLLNDFLRYARARRLELKPGSLNEVVATVLDLYEALAAESGVVVARFLDPELPSILLDGESLQAALVNLVKNALEAMPLGGELVARTRPTHGGVALDLIDTGQGMDEQTALRMFEAFFTTKDGGTGLGLPTARKTIEAHGGAIDVQSVVGRGTKFTLEFPTPPRIG